MPTKRIDKGWFKQKLSQNNQSMRQLSNRLGLDVSAVSRIFSGSRKMQMNEAYAIALFLGVPWPEVLRRAGMPRGTEAGEPTVLLAASIDETGRIKRLAQPKSLPSAVMARARAVLTLHGGSVNAAQVRATVGAFAIFDDAVVLFRETDIVEPAAVGALSICRGTDGEEMLCKVERSRKTGETLVTLASGEVRELTLDAAAPVLAVIP